MVNQSEQLAVIQFLINEMKEQSEYADYYEKTQQNIAIQVQDIQNGVERYKTRRKLEKQMQVEKKPDYALIKQNSKKIRKLLLKMY